MYVCYLRVRSGATDKATIAKIARTEMTTQVFSILRLLFFVCIYKV